MAPAPLTPEQISTIKTTWKIPAQNTYATGEAIFLTFFERFPENQKKFLAFKNVPLTELKVRQYLFIIQRQKNSLYYKDVVCLFIGSYQLLSLVLFFFITS